MQMNKTQMNKTQMNKTQPRSTQQQLQQQPSQVANSTATARSNTMQTLMSGTPGGAPRIDCQLEIFPLQTGSNPAQSEGGPRRPGSSDRNPGARSVSLSSRGDGSSVDARVDARVSNTPKPPTFPSLWSVAHQAWAAVDRRRARGRGLAATDSSQQCVRQQGSATVLQPDALNPREERHIWSPIVSLIGERQVKDDGTQIDGDRLTRFELVLAAMGVPAAALLFFCVL